mgnify:FL=1
MNSNKINNNFVYLISPNKIRDKKFYNDLTLIFKSGKVSFFQLRLKKETSKNKLIIGKKIKKICNKFKVKFLVNDNPKLAEELNADGCHLGQKDMNIQEARKILKNKIIGITCHNSVKLAEEAIKNGADYLAFGAFYSTKTKVTKYYANTKILSWSKNNVKVPVVAIGGITDKNYSNLIENGADLIAISSFIWRNKDKLKAVKSFNKN